MCDFLAPESNARRVRFSMNLSISFGVFASISDFTAAIEMHLLVDNLRHIFALFSANVDYN